MSKFSSTGNIDAKYTNSQVSHRTQGYPSSYTPSPALVPGSVLRNSQIAASTLPALPPGTQVIRVEEPPQVIYHQPPVGQVTTTQRKVISAGVPTSVRGMTEQAKSSGCPWWGYLILGIVGLLILAAIGFGLWTYLARDAEANSAKEVISTMEQRRQTSSITTAPSPPIQQQRSSAAVTADNQPSSETKVTKLVCDEGFFLNNGKCISCPKDTAWNGTNCIRKRAVTEVVSSESDKTVSGTEDNESELGKKSHLYAEEGDNDSLDTASNSVKSGLKTAARTTGNVLSDAWDGSKRLASRAWEGAKDAGRRAENSPSPVISGVATGARRVADTTSDAASSAWQGAKNIQRNAQNSQNPAVSGVATGLRDVSDATKGIASSAWNGTKDLFRRATDQHPHHLRQRI